MDGEEQLLRDEHVDLTQPVRLARRKTPSCSRCQRRIVGPRLVVGGLWTCAACVYEQEHPAKREGRGAPH